MAGDEVVLNFLDSSELDIIPQAIKDKLENVFRKYVGENDDLKIKYERLKVNSEQQYFDIEKQLVTSNRKLVAETTENTELKTSLTQIEQKYKDISEKYAEFRETQEGSLASQLHLTKVNDQLEAEKRDLTVLLDKRNKEIDRLNEEWKEITEKLSKATSAKCEAQAKLSDLQSSQVTTEFQHKRLQQENEQMKGQIDWLNTDLGEKTKELMNCRKEQNSKVINIQTQLEEKVDEVKQLTDTVESLKKTCSDKENKVEKLIQRSKDAADANIQSEEQFRKELEAKSKLIELYKGSAEDAEDKVTELNRAVEELQKLLQVSADEHTIMEKEKNEEIGKLTVEINKKEDDIRKLNQELINANDLIEAARKKNATDQQVETMFPSAAATSKYLKSGMTLTQIYNEYVNTSDELRLEKEENQRLQQSLDLVLQEIEEKAPILRKQREDYEKCLNNIDQLTKQLDGALLENQTLRSEADESIRKYNYMQRENHKYQQQMLDLSHQVQFLVKEIEEVKTGRAIRTDINLSSQEVSSSSDAISSRLVTFRDIEELQMQNQRLLSVARALGEEKEKEERIATESKTKELKEELQMAQNELKELKIARDRQQEMVQAIINQRDMYKVLAQENAGAIPSSLSTTPMPSRSASSIMRSPVSSRSSGLEATIEETKTALKQMTENFTTYKKEKNENERILNDQMEKAREELNGFRVQNAKLASQLDFQAERYKVLQGNNDGYKKEIASLREKIQKYSTSVAKHEQTINTLRQDSMSAKEDLARSQAQNQNMRMEKELLKSSEGRLLQEIESLRRERHSQTMLMANLEAIKNNLERSEFETKTRYSNKIEALEMEVNNLKRKLNDENDERKALTTLWENNTRTLRAQLEQRIKDHEDNKLKFIALDKEKQELRQKVLDLEMQLLAAEQAALNRGSTSTVVPGQTQSESSALDREKIKDLQSSLDQSTLEIRQLKEQLEQVKSQREQFKTIADGLQKTVDEHGDVSKEFETRRQKILEDSHRAKQLAEKMEKEKQELLNENIRLTEESHNLNADLRKKLAETQNELQDAVERREVAISNEMLAIEESSRQTQLAAETQDKYQRELILHAADVETLTVIKKQMEEFNTKIATEKDIRIQAENKLEEHLSSASDKEKFVKTEMERHEQRNKDLTNQNKLLHEQMEKMSKDLLSVQAAVTRRESLNVSFSEESSKSSEQLLEVIKFLRKEKDIAESRLEVVQAEINRFKQRNEMLQKEVEDANSTLQEEREQSQANLQTAAQHAELMRKVENLNLLSDSNKLLREEKEQIRQEVETLEAKVRKLESDISPLMQESRDKQVSIDTLSAEKNALKTEVNRWKARTTHLIEEANKADPEKMKLIQERENVRKEMSRMTEDNQKLKRELEVVRKEKTTLMNENQNVRQEKESVRGELSTITEENHRLKAEISKLNQNIQSLQKDISSQKEDITKLKEKIETFENENQKKDSELDEKQKTILQLKKIGRKYKEQAETIGKELEEVKQKLTAQEVQQQPNTTVIQQKEQITSIQKEKDELKANLEKVENDLKTMKEKEQKLDEAQTELAKLKEEKEDHEKKLNQSKQVLLAVRKKLASQNEEIQQKDAEIEKMKQKLSSSSESSSAAECKIKSQYEGRITSLEKELADLKEAAVAAGQVAEMKANEEKLEKEKLELQAKITEQQSKITELQTKIQQLQKPPKAVGPQTQVARPSPTVAVEGTSQSSEAPPPKTAPIRPIASPVARAHPTPSQTQANVKATASIRPMPSPLSVAVTTPTATVMPTTVSHQEPQEEGVPAAQVSPVTATTRPTQQVQRVIPQQDISEPSMTETEVSTSSQPETVVVEPQQTTSLQQQSTVVTPMSQQTSTAVATPIVQPTVQPSTSAGTSREGAAKRTREDSVEEETTEAKRSKMTQPQEAQVLPSIVVTEAEERTQPPTQDTIEETQEEQPTQTGFDDSLQDTQVFPEEALEEEEDRDESQPLPSTSEVPVEGTEEEIEEEDDGVIILDVDNDESGEGDQDQEYEEGDDDGEEEEEADEEDDDDIYEDMDDFNNEGQEGDDAGPEEEYHGEGDMEEEGYPADQEDMQDDQQGEGDDDDDDDAVVIIESDEEESGMDAQEEESQPTTQTTTASVQPVVVQQSAQPIERQISVTRTHLTPFVIGSQGYEDGEDGIVPSTPTLYIPNRGDGFAEAINSPMVQQRFIFGLSSAESQPDLAQLESQRASGMDDTRMDLSQLQDSGGRSVPSTPLRTTAPVSISESALAVASQPVIETSAPQVSEDTISEEVPQSGAIEEQTEQEPTDSGSVPTSQDETDAQPGPSSESTDQEGGASGSREEVPDKTDAAGKPKIEPIVWETGAQIKTQTGHTGQAFRSRPPRRGQPPYQGHAQQRGRGQFQRGRSPVARTTRGGSRGSRGGMFRSPNMF